jgi:hypothetical protein
MNPTKHQRWAEAVTAWRRYGEQHFVGYQGPKALLQPFQFIDGHSGADTARVNEVSLRCVVAQQQRPDPMSDAFGLTPSDEYKLFPVQAFDLKRCTPIRVIPAIDVNWRP